jgi:Holliday junction resolvase RusA-like endonuclease
MAQGHLRSRRRWTMEDVVRVQAQMTDMQRDNQALVHRLHVKDVAAQEINRARFAGFSFQLPWAPSVNNAYANRSDGEGRVKTKRSKAYAQLAEFALLEQRVPCNRLAHPLTIHYIQHASSDRGDVANYEKILTDTLVRFGVIHDDRRDILKRVTLEDGSRVEPGHEYVEVRISCLL